MTGTGLVTAIIEILVSGLTAMGAGIGSALTSMVTSLIYTTEGTTTTLSAFAILVIAFAGISLAFTLTRWVVNLFTSFGNRNR